MNARRKLSACERQAIYSKTDGHCAYCGKPIALNKMQVDHVMPVKFYASYKAKGIDVNCIDNMMPACKSCNHYKSSMTLEKFRSAIERFSNALKRDDVTYRNAVRFGQVISNKHKVVFYFEKENRGGKI